MIGPHYETSNMLRQPHDRESVNEDAYMDCACLHVRYLNN